MNKPSIPDGYTAFPDVMATLFYQHRDWKCQNLQLHLALRRHEVEPGDFMSELNAYRNWCSDAYAESFVRHVLGTRLANQRSRSVGISVETGDFSWLSAATWRLFLSTGEAGKRISMIDAAFLGHCVRMPSRVENQPDYYPLLSWRELALAFEAETLPPEPPLAPIESLGEETPSLEQPNPNPVSWPADPVTALGATKVLEGVDTPQAAKSKSLGGRPTVHDWDAFWIEVASKADLDGLKPEHRRELRKHLLEWWERTSDNPPEPTTVDKKLTRLYRAIADRQT